MTCCDCRLPWAKSLPEEIVLLDFTQIFSFLKKWYWELENLSVKTGWKMWKLHVKIYFYSGYIVEQLCELIFLYLQIPCTMWHVSLPMHEDTGAGFPVAQALLPEAGLGFSHVCLSHYSSSGPLWKINPMFPQMKIKQSTYLQWGEGVVEELV